MDSKRFHRIAVAWLLDSRKNTSAKVRAQVQAGLFGSLPIFFGGVFNSIAIAVVAYARHPSFAFAIWLGLEACLALVRIPVIVCGRRAIDRGGKPPIGLAAVLACGWAASVGFGTSITIWSGDWLLAVLVCLSAAAMVSGICLRNFGTPRLAALMVSLTLVPMIIAGAGAPDPMLAIICVQLPVFMYAIFHSSFALHHMWISEATALANLEQSENLNRTILQASVDYTLILDEAGKIEFLSTPHTHGVHDPSLARVDWVELVYPGDRDEALRALNTARSGAPARFTTRRVDPHGQLRWFDLIVTPVADGSRRTMIVARDISHQKASEEKAIWMARHDGLTGLPNRVVLQDELEQVLAAGRPEWFWALLIVDVDDFKSINDSLGHDAGDVLLRAFGQRLRDAVGAAGLVSRLGGDEFALLVPLDHVSELEALAARIYEKVRQPIEYEGRTFECSASIGASFLFEDGATRAEIIKAADIALYAAKADGRGHMKVFRPSMKQSVERQQAVITTARTALKRDRIRPFYQPKMDLRSDRIVGFEALLRWAGESNEWQLPSKMREAFQDTQLSADITDRILAQTIDQMCDWSRRGVDFGHVAINVTGGDFKRPGFAQNILDRLRLAQLPPSVLQIEVTETVLLDRSADHVVPALRRLSAEGVRIALDDFGTGYASLAHLKEFPVDLLKIDRSFVGELGYNAHAEAIVTAVVNLGHCLGMEIVAEGVETHDQHAMLASLGCDSAQGFLYSPAVSCEQVPRLLGALGGKNPTPAEPLGRVFRASQSEAGAGHRAAR